MVFGGSAHPDQDDHFAWLGHEEEFLKDVLVERVPVFGVCLGAQMLARAAGAKVGPASAPEVGWLDVELTPEGESDPVLGVLPRQAKVFQWHHYTFDIPEGGTRARPKRRVHSGLPASPAAPGASSSMPRSRSRWSRRGQARIPTSSR